MIFNEKKKKTRPFAFRSLLFASATIILCHAIHLFVSTWFHICLRILATASITSELTTPAPNNNNNEVFFQGKRLFSSKKQK